MPKITPFLSFDGRADEATNFYTSVFKDSKIGKVVRMPEGGQPPQCGWLKDKFGLNWQVVPTALSKLLSDPDRAKSGRVMAAMMQMVKFNIAKLEAAANG